MKKKFTRIHRVPGIAVALVAVLMATGCAGGGASEAGQASSAIDEDATLRVGVKFLGESWDPSQSKAPADLPMLRLVYDGLLEVDADRNPVPALAESWETDDGGVTWDFHLRDDAVFSSGDTFDAEDAKATLDYYRTETSTLRPDLSLVEEVQVIDPQTLRIVNSSPNAETPGVFSGRAGLMLSSDEIDASDVASPIGTGRFTLAEETTGISFDLEAHDAYWQREVVKVGGVHVEAIEDPISMANALRSQEIDLGIVDPTQVSTVTSAGLQTYEFPSQLVALGLNPDLAPELADQRVRNALSLAIDREGIVNGVLFGHGRAANQFFDESSSGFDAGLPPFEYDLEAAKALLQEAGYGDGFSFTIAVQAANRQLMEAIQAGWAEIGVDVELTFPAGSGVTEAAWGESPTVAVAPTNASPPHGQSSFLRRMLDPASPRNPGGIGDDRVTALIADSYGTVDDDARAEVYREISGIVHEDTQSYIPVVWRHETVTAGKNVIGMREWLGGFPVLDGVGIAAN
ncbi:ABC transporter substrate-binding protein [Microbacterium sp. A93]|uniref:ABC transporter substrate-binding protein n=1 Tax=Microbacterium sp. A93 TaxID=3450716 RepID=UPI003F41B560